MLYLTIGLSNYRNWMNNNRFIWPLKVAYCTPKAHMEMHNWNLESITFYRFTIIDKAA